MLADVSLPGAKALGLCPLRVDRSELRRCIEDGFFF